MLRHLRAARLAAAALAAAVTLGWSASLLASPTSAISAASPAHLAHAAVSSALSDLGLNDGAAAARRPTLDDAVARHMTTLLDSVDLAERSLIELVDLHGAFTVENAEQNCLANAVYFEARGESLEGQLAVAEVVLNRAASGRYPASICGVVTQPAQFSFVRRGTIPRANRASEAWRRAVAIARIAESRAKRLLPTNVLWYHANYVTPAWCRRLDRNTQIGLHIFYS